MRKIFTNVLWANVNFEEGVMYMKNIGSQRRRGMAFRVLTGAVLSLGLLSVDARANTLPLGACAKLSGTYLTSVFTPAGDFSLRGLLTFTPTGAMFVVESAEGGLEGIVNPYSDAQGAWKCVARQGDTIKAQATVLDFTFPGSLGSQQFIARVDYDISLDAPSGTIGGTLELRLFPLQGDPLNTPAPPFAEFEFEGERVRAQ
jgi:hypothetical protein